MGRHPLLHGLLLMLLAVLPVRAVAAETPKKPNIVFILADDKDYGVVQE